jgi:uncharacterized OsmC-like protein
MAAQQTIHAVNGIDMDTLKRTIDAIKDDPALGQCHFHVQNHWIDGNHNRTTIRSFYGAKEERPHKQPFEIDCDEPAILAGADGGANPVEHLLNSLAGCVTTSMVAHAAVRGIEIEELESQVEGDIDLRGFLGLAEDVPKGYTNIRVHFKVKADVDNMERLKRLAEYSPTFNTLIHGVKVDINVEPK